VERALNELDGIQETNVDLGSKQVIVNYDANKVTADGIKTAIEDIGYDVE
jgi:copper chaperone CopZ